MEIGQKIDNKYLVLGISEQVDNIQLLSVLNGIERAHMLVFLNSPENADNYNNFEYFSFEGAITSAKTDTLAYVLLPYDDSLSIADYMLRMYHKEQLSNASTSYDRIMIDVRFYEAMIRTLPEGIAKDMYKNRLKQAMRDLKELKAKEKAEQKNKAPSIFDRIRTIVGEFSGTNTKTKQSKPRDTRTTTSIPRAANPVPRTASVASQFANHYMLSRKNIGASKELKGDVKLFVIMVNDPESKWTEADKERFLDVCKQSCMFLMDQARLVYNTTLKLSTVYDMVTLDYTLSRRNNAPLVPQLQPIIEHYGVGDASALQQTVETRYNASEAPVIFAVNKVSRPCALTATTAFLSTPHEWSYVGKNPNGQFHYVPLAHEILHQFGAEDFYHPPKVYENAKEFFPDSLMHYGSTVDALTAYLVGWTSDLLPTAAKFMNSVKDVTAKDYLASLELENKKTKC